MPYNADIYGAAAQGGLFDYGKAMSGFGRNLGAGIDASRGIDHSQDFERALREQMGQVDDASGIGRDDGIGGMTEGNWLERFYGNGGGGAGFRRGMSIYKDLTSESSYAPIGEAAYGAAGGGKTAGWVAAVKSM